MTRRTTLGFVLLSLWVLAAARAGEAERPLLNFTAGFDVKQLTPQDATVTLSKTTDRMALRVTTGHTEPWPGVTLPAPGGKWDLAAFGWVALGVRNAGSHRVTVSCRVDNAGADGTRNCVTESLTLEPGAAGTLRVALKRHGEGTLGGKLFGMRGYPAGPPGQASIDPARVTQLVVFVNRPQAEQVFELSQLRAGGSFTPPTAAVLDAAPFLPFIDAFGQYRHKDWLGKTRTLADLARQHAAEETALREQPGPPGWDKFGGWAEGPQLGATGFFRTAKHAGKWWLVDPDGRLFFSHGIDCVLMLDSTPVDEREEWFQDFPGAQPELAGFLHPGFALKGHYAGKSPRTFSFAAANFRRKYGPDWRAAAAATAHARLRAWGLNTVGLWSDDIMRRGRRTPYVDALNSREARNIAGSEGYWGKFPDVFDPSFRASLRQQMTGKAGSSTGDPWCLGFFSDNELSWGDETSLALASLQSPPDQPAKQAFVSELKAKYDGIAALNGAWGTPCASWEALLERREAPNPDQARADLTAFSTRLAEEYFRVVREVIHEVAPHQLYLGCRFAWVNARAAAAAARYCDVVSYNLYQRSVADFRLPGGADVPLLIGEFHFGALDRGLFHTGLVPVADQAARAQAYRDYLLGALRHAQFVGCHWFQYQDEPTTGRVYDEENYQIGFVDGADTPYHETITAARAVAEEMYAERRRAAP